MKLRSKLLMYTASAALFANVAYAAVDAQALADSYLAEGYTFVEVKTGPTQTKVEAIKGETEVEVIYDNETGDIISQESQAADADQVGREGVEIGSSDEDFEDSDDGDDGDDGDENDDDSDDDEDDNNGHGNDDDHDDEGNPGKGGGGHGSDDDEGDDSDDDEDDQD
jgi:hypothetical protein